jgi:hypothetical protein
MPDGYSKNELAKSPSPEERRGKRRYSYMPEGDDVVIDEFKQALSAQEEW